MFVRASHSRGHVYYQLVESYKVKGKSRTRVLKHLGKEIPEEYKHLRHKKGKQLPLK